MADYDVIPRSLDDKRPLQDRRIEEGDEVYALHLAAVANDPAGVVRGFVKLMLAGARLFVRETGKWYENWPDVAVLAEDYQRSKRKQQVEKAADARRGQTKKRPEFWPTDEHVKRARADWKTPSISIQRMADDYDTDRRTLRKWAKIFKFGDKPGWQR